MADEKTLKEVSADVTKQLGDRASVLERFSVAFKIAIAVGAVVTGVAKVADLHAAFSYVAVTVIFCATVLVLFADKGASKTLTQARQALDKARDAELESDARKRKFDAAEAAYSDEIERLSHLQAARDLFRAILENVATSPHKFDEITVIDLMLQQARRALFLAHGFEMSDYHTICVYRRELSADGGAELHCKAHIRAIDCDLKKARVWKEGVGVAGASLAQRNEVIVPDLSAPELGTLYRIKDLKPDDHTHYRSIVAEPISLDADGALWGILIVTSSKPGHFTVEDRSYVNVAESLAGMISLAVKLTRAKVGSSTGSTSAAAENH
jgi:hypothetical protein